MTSQNVNGLDDAARWFETQETRTLRFFACRAALRVLPIWIETASSPRFRIGSRHILPVLRSNIIGLSLFCSENSVSRFTSFQASQDAYKSGALADDKDDAAALAANFSGYTHLSFSAEGPNSSSRWMVARACGEIESIATLKSGSKAVQSNAELPWALFNYDTQSAFSFRFFSEPLWETIPEWAMAALDFMRSAWVLSASGGDFWMRWYQGFLDGTPLPWGLQRDIALIPDADWQKGEAHIARLIEIIEERHRLLGLVADLKKSLAEATATSTAIATPEHRNHNHPPELIDAPAQLREAVTLVRRALDEAETELAKPGPAPSKLKRIAQVLADAVLAAVTYCGAKLDVFITKAVEEGGTAFGKWGIAAAVAYWATPTGTMQSLIKGLTDLAVKLSH